MNIIEEIRQNAVADLFKTATVNNCWQRWGREIRAIIGNDPTPQSILDLGDHLAEVFRTTGQEGRDQSELSGGGTGWEALITWYFNLCTLGSRVVAIKKTGSLPTPIRDSITVGKAARV